ncbi:MAG: M15 family metallopeptidase [Eubacteriales bacterium]
MKRRIIYLATTVVLILVLFSLTGCKGKTYDTEPSASASASPSVSTSVVPTLAEPEYANWILTENFASRVNFRSSPNVLEDNLLGMIYDREPVVVLDPSIESEDIEWAYIEYGDEKGYVAASYITDEEPLSILEAFAEGIYLNDYKSDETLRSQLVKVSDIAPTVLVDITLAQEINYVSIYADEQGNSTVGALYKNDHAMIQKSTGEKLAKAAALLEEAGYQLMLWDAYRPYFVTLQIYEIVDDEKLIPYPELGESLNSGAAVDVTLYKDNQPVVGMPTPDRVIGFDGQVVKYSENTMLGLLTDAMTQAGFEADSEKWWRFNDTNYKTYPVINFELEIFDQDDLQE